MSSLFNVFHKWLALIKKPSVRSHRFEYRHFWQAINRGVDYFDQNQPWHPNRAMEQLEDYEGFYDCYPDADGNYPDEN